MFLIRILKRMFLYGLISMFLVALFLSRCSVEEWYQQIRESVSQEAASVTISEDSLPIVNQAKASLVKELGLNSDDVKLVKAEFILWPDSCLGIQSQNVNCTRVITPGYKIIFKVAGAEIEYHADQKSGRFVKAN